MTMKSFYDVFPTADKAYFRGKDQEELDKLKDKALRLLANEVEVTEYPKGTFNINADESFGNLVVEIGLLKDKINNTPRKVKLNRSGAYVVGLECLFESRTRECGDFKYMFKAFVNSPTSYYASMTPIQVELDPNREKSEF